MKSFKKLILSMALSAVLMSAAMAQNKNYEAGQKSMLAQNYKKAYENFIQSQKDEDYQEASIYWQAYSLFKMRQNNTARKLLNDLIKNYPQGRWKDSAQMLLLENNLPQERAERIERTERPERIERVERVEKSERIERIEAIEPSEKIELSDDLRLFTIQQIFFNNQEKGLPLIEDLLEKSADINTKMNALQLLGISESNQAQQYLYKFVLENKEQELSNQAIQMLSIRSSKQSNDLLSQLYNKISDKQLKSSIIHGFVQSEDPESLIKMMGNEKDKELNNQMIQVLGILGAHKQLEKLNIQLTDIESKRAIMQALAISGDSQALKNMIEGKTNKDIKMEAIQSLAIVDDRNIQDYLLDLYPKENDIEIKQALSSAFIINNVESKKVIALIESEKNIESKFILLDSLLALGQDSDLVNLYETEKDLEVKHKILDLLGIQGSSNQIRQLYKNMDSMQEKIQALQALGLGPNQDSKDFLTEAYKTGNLEIKMVVIQSLMIQDNANALSKLLKTETNHELKKKLIQAIAMTGSIEMLENINQ